MVKIETDDRILLLEKRLSALEAQIQKIPDDVVDRLFKIIHQCETQYALQACQAVLPRRLKENSTDSDVE